MEIALKITVCTLLWVVVMTFSFTSENSQKETVPILTYACISHIESTDMLFMLSADR